MLILSYNKMLDKHVASENIAPLHNKGEQCLNNHKFRIDEGMGDVTNGEKNLQLVVWITIKMIPSAMS